MNDDSPFVIDHSTPVLGLLRVLLVAFLLVALSLIFWTAVRAPALLIREDNPRLVEAELRIQRGTIFDRNNNLLAVTTGTGNELIRQYPAESSSHAVGYYSFKHGTAGVEESMDAILRGETGDLWRNWWRDTQHLPQIGHDVRLTLDANLQQTADSLLGDTKGAIILLTLNGNTADILALASHPSYDPNTLDAQFDALTSDENAPLLNRATQGQYQPGMMLAPFIVATAVEQGVISLDDTVANPNRPIAVDGTIKQCATSPPNPTTWRDVLRHRCPAPLQTLGQQLGIAGLNQSFTTFRLTESPQFPLNTEVPPSIPLKNAQQAAIGQDNLVITPLQLALAWGALGSNGRYPHPLLVTESQDETGTWQTYQRSDDEQLTVSSQTTQVVRQSLPQVQSIREYSNLVLSGPDGSTNGWYLGLYPAGDPQYAIVVVLEGSQDLAEAENVGRSVLTAQSIIR